MLSAFALFAALLFGSAHPAIAEHHHHHHDVPAYQRWAHTEKAREVTWCESRDESDLVDSNGGVDYFGRWQMNSDFVRAYAHVDAYSYVHGGRFTLSKRQQDRAAYRGWRRRGWEPWACA